MDFKTIKTMMQLDSSGVADKEQILGCELAISDNAKCIMCEERITQNTPRLWIEGDYKCPPPDEGIKKIRRFICHQCSKMTFDIKERIHKKQIKKGELAKLEKEELEPIKRIFLGFLQDEKIKKVIRNDEIMKELAKDGEKRN